MTLRAGNEKEEGETADTVGCCSLRVEHMNIYPEKDGQEYVVEFDFLGKDSIRYYNKVPVSKRVRPSTHTHTQMFISHTPTHTHQLTHIHTCMHTRTHTHAHTPTHTHTKAAF